MDNSKFGACRVWELIPVGVDSLAARSSSSSMLLRDSSPSPPYEGNVGECCYACSHLIENLGDGDFDTTVVEVTTVTTRKKYSSAKRKNPLSLTFLLFFSLLCFFFYVFLDFSRLCPQPL